MNSWDWNFLNMNKILRLAIIYLFIFRCGILGTALQMNLKCVEIWLHFFLIT